MAKKTVKLTINKAMVPILQDQLKKLREEISESNKAGNLDAVREGLGKLALLDETLEELKKHEDKIALDNVGDPLSFGM